MNAPNQIHHTDPAKPANPLYRRSCRHDDWAFKEDAKAQRVLDRMERDAVELLEQFRSDMTGHPSVPPGGPAGIAGQSAVIAGTAKVLMAKWLEKLEAGRERETSIL